MNSEFNSIDDHQWAARSIPWYVNGTLEAAEAAQLGAHLQVCARCQRDYEAQVRLFDAMQSDGTLVFAAEPSFNKLMARIGTREDAGALATLGPMPAPVKSSVPVERRKASGFTRWLAAAVLLEGIGLGYGAWAVHQGSVAPSSPYVTLTSAQPSYRDSPRVRIVFGSGLSVQGLGMVLRGVGAHIIDGPTDSNVYTLGFAGTEATPGVVERRIAALRANADVLFAEPLGTGNDHR